MTPLLSPIKDLARGAILTLRAALRQGALIGVALLIATLGAGFLVFAAFLGLQFLFGAGLAALTIGAALLILAAGVLMLAKKASPPDAPASRMHTPPEATRPGSADPATMAVFTAAFVLGRHLANGRNPPDNS